MKKWLGLFLFFPLFSWANSSPVEVSLRETRDNGFVFKKVEVVSLVDRIAINDVQLNRGNCEVLGRALTQNTHDACNVTAAFGDPADLQRCVNGLQERQQSGNRIILGYGEKTSFGYPASCRLREVEVRTNLGTWINNQFTPLESNEEEGMEYICDGCDEEATIYQHFDNVGGKTVELLKFPAMGMSCPGGTFMFRDATSETEPFGTCSETVDIRQKGDKIIVTMPGYQYASFGDGEDIIKASEKADKEIWQYIYQNGKLEINQLK